MPKCCLIEVVAPARMGGLGPLDLAREDVLIGVVGALEQQAWIVRAEGVL